MEKTAEVSVFQKKVLGLRLRTWLFLILAVPILIWAFLNLLFSTGFGTGLIEKRIKDRIGLSCQIGSVTWSPWAGVTIQDFAVYSLGEVVKSSRIVHVKHVHVDLSWFSLLKGKQRFERVEVRGLLGELSIEQVKEMMSLYHRRYPVIVLGSAGSQKLPSKNDERLLESPKQVPERAQEVDVQPKKNPEKEGGGDVFEDAVVVDDFEGVVILKDVHFRLFSEERPELELNLNEFEAEIPIWGEARKGALQIRSIEFGKYLSDLKMNFPLRWDGDSIRVDESDFKLFGVDFEVAAQMRMTRGFPFGLGVNLPDQQMDLTPIYLERSGPVDVAHLRSQNVFQGHLLNFRSFTGRSVTTFSDLVFHDPKDGGDVRFDRGSAIVSLSSGGLVVNDVRAIGEEDSILMNGFVSTGGDAVATVRIVSSPSRAESHEKRVRKSSPLLSLEFEPLLTPDREYRDIRIESRLGNFMMDLGVEESWVPFVPALRAILGMSPPPKQLP